MTPINQHSDCKLTAPSTIAILGMSLSKKHDSYQNKQALQNGVRGTKKKRCLLACSGMVMGKILFLYSQYSWLIPLQALLIGMTKILKILSQRNRTYGIFEWKTISKLLLWLIPPWLPLFTNTELGTLYATIPSNIWMVSLTSGKLQSGMQQQMNVSFFSQILMYHAGTGRCGHVMCLLQQRY